MRDRLRRAAFFAMVCLLPSTAAWADASPQVNAANASGNDQRFSFVVHGDLTGGERPGVFEAAAAQVALLQPEFVISVGDLIEGDGTSATALDQQWDAYEMRAAAMGAPLYLVGGNHDLTSELQREVWRKRYGATYYHFRHDNVLFLVLDTEDYGPARRTEIARARDEALVVAQRDGWDAFAQTTYAQMPERGSGAISPAQRDYFLDVLAEHADVRWTFLFMHKAPWEGGSATFEQLETVLATRPYTVFHGHEHAQHHQLRQGRDYIRLATTGGVQLEENGRAVDHLTLVTVGERVSVATLDLVGIRDAAGKLP